MIGVHSIGEGTKVPLYYEKSTDMLTHSHCGITEQKLEDHLSSYVASSKYEDDLVNGYEVEGANRKKLVSLLPKIGRAHV